VIAPRRAAILLALVLSVRLAALVEVHELREAAAVPADGLAWLAESGQPLEVGSILSGRLDGRFTPAADGRVPLESGAVWLRLRVRDAANQDIGWSLLLDAWALRDVRFYRAAGAGDWQVSPGGTAVPEHQRESAGLAWQFAIYPREPRTDHGQTTTVYCRVAAPLSGGWLPVWVGGDRALRQFQYLENLRLALLGGAYACIFLVCVALFLGTIARPCAILAALSGLAMLQYFAGSGLLPFVLGMGTADSSLAHVPDLYCLYLACSLFLLMHFIRLRSTMPRAHRLGRLAALATAALGAGMAFVPDSLARSLKLPAMLAILVLVGSLRLAAAWLGFRRGTRSGLLCLIAFGADTAAALFLAAATAGWIFLDPAGRQLALSGGLVQFLILIYITAIRSRHQRGPAASRHPR
jgi:hypothetical protein